MGHAAVTVGVIGKPHGLRGEVTVRADPDLGEGFPPGRVYLVVGWESSLTVATSRMHGYRRLVRFEGIDDRDAAEALRGLELAVPRSDIRLGPDEFWVEELVGRPAVDRAGRPLGTVTDVTDGQAHDYLVITGPRGEEALVPVVADLVDVTDESVVVDAIPGLLGHSGEEDQ